MTGSVVPSRPFPPGPSRVWFLTHPEVEVHPTIPVPQWGLSEVGERRAQDFRPAWRLRLGAIFSSPEKKARVTAFHLARTAQFSHRAIRTIPDLSENDRSATGYLPEEEFRITANLFFKHPRESIRGWEPARAAQERIVAAVHRLLETPVQGDIAISSHGGVGTLLLCHLKGVHIDRCEDQPRPGGGHYFGFDALTRQVLHGWRSFEEGTVGVEEG